MRQGLLVACSALVFGGCMVSGSIPSDGNTGTGTGNTSSGANTSTGGSGVGTGAQPGTGGTGVSSTGGTGVSSTGGTSVSSAGGTPSGAGGAGATSAGGSLGAAGSSSMAGAAAGGAPPTPATGNGYQPAGLTSADSSTAYTTWKGKYLMACGDGSSRVVKNGNETVSEGIGYGMLMSVNNNDHATFDALWKYYQARRNGNGLMNWKIDGCTTTATGQNGATDGDLDAAMALIMADKRWTGYTSAATALITAIKGHELATLNGMTVLKPGDAYTNTDCINYSYFAPGYERAFAKYVSDTSWTKVADDSYTLINSAANGTTGLVPNWSNGSFQPGCANGDGTYGYDAARTPWRIAVDYVWYGTPAAKTYLTKLVNWVGNGISAVGDGYALNAANPAVSLSANHNSTFTGAFSCAAMAFSQARTEEFATALKAIKDNTYYEESLRGLYLLLLAGNFPPPA